MVRPLNFVVCWTCDADEGECGRRRGIEARRKFIEPVGAWFSQVGRLHQVHHMWQYT